MKKIEKVFPGMGLNCMVAIVTISTLSQTLHNKSEERDKKKQIKNYPKATKFTTPLIHPNTNAIRHITKAPILKHLLFLLYPALVMSDPAIIINRPDQIPPATELFQNREAAVIIKIPSMKVRVPMAVIAIPMEKRSKLLEPLTILTISDNK